MKQHLGYRTLSIMFSDISLMIPSSDSMEDILNIMSRDENDRETAKVLKELGEDLENGNSLSEAMKHSGRFPEYAISMTASAETAGRMEEVCASLAIYYNRRDQMRVLASGALVQPLILLILLAVIMGFFMFLVLPMLSSVYKALSGEAGVYSVISYAVAAAAFAVIAMVMLVLLFVWIQFKKEKSSGSLTKIWEHNPLTKNLAVMYDKSSFMIDLTTRVSGGITLDEAFESAAASVRNVPLREQLQSCSERLNHGDSLADVLYSEKVLPHVYIHILSGGMQAGALEQSLQRVGDMLYEEAETKTTDLIRRTEPMITGFFTVMTGISLLTIMLPLIGVITAIA